MRDKDFREESPAKWGGLVKSAAAALGGLMLLWWPVTGALVLIWAFWDRLGRLTLGVYDDWLGDGGRCLEDGMYPKVGLPLRRHGFCTVGCMRVYQFLSAIISNVPNQRIEHDQQQVG